MKNTRKEKSKSEFFKQHKSKNILSCAIADNGHVDESVKCKVTLK